MKLKRIIAFFIILTLSVSILGIMPASAASNDAVNLIYDLGIVEKIAASGLGEASYTRGDFAKSLIVMKNIEPMDLSAEAEKEETKADADEEAEGTEAKAEPKVYAEDISGNKNEDYIASVIVYGYMGNDADGNFRPNDALTRIDAVRALVCALNYDIVADKRGGDDAAYLAVASKIGLLAGVSIADSFGLKVSEAAELLANAMGIQIYYDNELILEDLCYFDSWDLTKHTGKLMATSTVGLATETAPSNQVNIGGKLFYTDILIADEMVGSDVTVYTRSLSSGETVVSIYSKTSAQNPVVTPDEIESVKKTSQGLSITLRNGKELDVDKLGYAIVNGKTVTPDKSLFDAFKNGSITFVDSDRDGNFDVLHMTLLETMLLEGASADGETFLTKYYKQLANLENYDTAEVYIDKKSATLSDLQAGMVIDVAADGFEIKDGIIKTDFEKSKNIKIYAITRKASGKVISIADESDVFIDDLDYGLGELYIKLVQDGHIQKLSAGDYINAWFDSTGHLAYYELDNTKGMQYGYMLAADKKKEGLKNELKFKIRAADNEFLTVLAAEKIIFDGERVEAKDVETVHTLSSGQTVDLTKRQVIKYRLSEDGLLKEIDTAVLNSKTETKENSLTEDFVFDEYGTGGKQSKIFTGVIDREWAVLASSAVFIDEELLSETMPQEKRITAQSLSALGSDAYLAGYDVNEMKELACVVNYKAYGRTESEGVTKGLQYDGYRCYVVEKIKESLSRSGEEGWTITLTGDNTKGNHFVSKEDTRLYATSHNIDDWGGENTQVMEYDIAEFTNVIGVGDVVRYRKNSLGVIDHLERVCDFSASKDTIVEIPKKGGQIMGYANVEKTTAEGTIMYSYGSLLSDPDTRSYILKKKARFTTVPLFDEETGKTSLVSYADLPSAVTGEKVRVFLRYYNYGDILDYIFYVLK